MFHNFLDDGYQNSLRDLLHDNHSQVPMINELVFGSSSDESSPENIACSWIWNDEDSQREINLSEESSSINQMIIAREEQERKIKEFMELNKQLPEATILSRKISCQTTHSSRAKKEKKIKKRIR